MRHIHLSTGLVTTLAGNTSGTVGVNNKGFADGLGTAAAFRFPWGVALSPGGVFAIIVRDLQIDVLGANGDAVTARRRFHHRGDRRTGKTT